MIIGISGKIGSGKDTVASIIRLLSLGVTPSDIPRIIKEKYDFPLPDVDKGYYDWEINRFAGMVKNIVCMLTDCTREQLEDEAFKNKQLGEEWKIWEWQEVIKTAYDYSSPTVIRRIAMHEPMGWPYNRINVKQIILTRRRLLQLIGTDCGRNIIHPNIWVNALMSRYNSKFAGSDGITKYDYKDHTMKITSISVKDHPIFEPNNFPNWIIPDVRFPNEAVAIENKGGILIRVNSNYVIKKTSRIPRLKELEHESETALDHYSRFHEVITNDSTIESLIKQVHNILLSRKIIQHDTGKL